MSQTPARAADGMLAARRQDAPHNRLRSRFPIPTKPLPRHAPLVARKPATGVNVPHGHRSRRPQRVLNNTPPAPEEQRSHWPHLVDSHPTCALTNATCFEQRIKQLASAYFAGLAAPVSPGQLLAAAQRNSKHCMLLRLEKRRVYMNATWRPQPGALWTMGRFKDVACLLRYAALRHLALPLVADLLVCGSDGLGSSDVLGGAPALTYTRHPRCPSCVPVPMVSRGALSEFSTVLNPELFFNGSSRMGRLLTGRHPDYGAGETPWHAKQPRAFFRGTDWTCGPRQRSTDRAVACPGGRCKQFYARNGTDGVGRASGSLTRADACFRARLVNGLQRVPGAARLFDVASGGAGSLRVVPERAWERNKMLLVIGSTLGWADRLMASMLKTSATVLVDAGTSEWYYPLLREGVHYLRTNSSVASVRETARWGLEHDDELSRIAAAGHAYARRLFTLDHLALYMAAIVRAWARRVNGTLDVKSNPRSSPRYALAPVKCGG